MKSVCAKSQTILLDFEMDMFYIYIYICYMNVCVWHLIVQESSILFGILLGF